MKGLKLCDINDEKILIYDRDRKRFHRFCQYLKKLGYLQMWKDDYSNVSVLQPCVGISGNKVFIWEMSAALDKNFCIIPTLTLDDFAENERRYTSKQADKVREIIGEAFSNDDI